VAGAGGLEQLRQPGQAGEVALTPLLGVEGKLRQHGEDARHRVDESVADGELNQGDAGRTGHVPAHEPYEVECLMLSFVEAGLGQAFRAFGNRGELSGLLELGGGAEVGEQGVVTGKPVQRPGERVGLEDGREEFGSEIVGGHGRRLSG